MRKFYLLFICFALFYIIFNVESFVIKAINNINIYNISNSDKYIAIESDENVNGNMFHYIFLYDVITNEKIRIYTNDGDKINSSMYFPSISNDGKYLTFTSRADNITGDVIDVCVDIVDDVVKNCSNIYLYNTEKKESILIKYNGADNFNGDNYISKISGNGTDIVFESISNNYSNFNYDCSFINGIKNCINIYKYNLFTKQVSLISTGRNNEGGNSNSINPSISDDGRFITYQSNSSNIVADVEMHKYCNNYITNQPDICSNIFFVDTMNMKTSILSFNDLKLFNDNSGNAIISGNGNFVAFESYSSNISKQAYRHLYLYDIVNQTIQLISKSGQVLHNRDSFVDDITNDGKYILYRTDSTNLETNKGIDLYVYNTLSEKKELISNNNISLSCFVGDNVYYYNNKGLTFNQIDSKAPIINSEQPIYILKENILNIINLIKVYDNLSDEENIVMHLNGLEYLKTEGEYELDVNVIDEFNNATVSTLKVIVLTKDEEAPIFNDIDEINVLKGTDSLNLANYIHANDRIDGKTRIYIIDDDKLNLNAVGNYKIKLMSKDNSNNVAYKEIEVIVYENYNFGYFYKLIIIIGIIVIIIFSIIKVK